MKCFNIFVHPQGKCEAVKQGWSWPAFLFCWIWAFVKKIWALGFGILVLATVIGFLTPDLDYEQSMVFRLVIALILGIILGVYGNSWREDNLRSRSFRYRDTITADSGERALMIFIQRQREDTETGNTNMS